MGIAKNNSASPVYIGWRTCAYGPVYKRRCPGSTVIVDAAKVFALSRNTRRKKPNAAITSISAITTIAV
jgi:hypothetical protein